jgi:hypothetical protein
MRRYSNGQFKSKRTAELEDKLRLYSVVGVLTLATMFGFALQPSYHTWERAEAYEPTHYCDLIVVDCVAEQSEVESEVDIAIQAIEEALGREVTETTKQRVKYLYMLTEKSGISFNHAVKNVYCESQWYSIKSYLPEESYGLAQIHIPVHNVTKEQALDAEFALNWMVEHWDTAKWYGYDRETGQCTNDLTINL